MITPNEPLLSAEARAALESYRYDAVHIAAALAEIDRLRSQVEALATELAHVCHDRMEEGARALVERAVSEEREACCWVICSDCRAGMSVKPNENGVWVHSERVGPSASAWHCDAHKVRARGPILPPLPPHRLTAENEQLRAVLARIIAVADDDTMGHALMGLRSAPAEIDAARKLLQSPPGG